jgi:excisionase family DNA binding protein
MESAAVEQGRPVADVAAYPQGLASAEQVAEFLQMSTSGVRQYIRAGRLPSVKLSRRVVRVPWTGVREFVAAHTAE